MFGCGSDCEEGWRSGLPVRAARGHTPAQRGRVARIYSRDSFLVLFRVDNGIVEEIGVGVIPPELENLRDEPSSRPAFDMDENFDRIANIRLDCFVRKLYAALQNTTREAGQGLFRR